jgi:hypothetical protein
MYTAFRWENLLQKNRLGGADNIKIALRITTDEKWTYVIQRHHLMACFVVNNAEPSGVVIEQALVQHTPPHSCEIWGSQGCEDDDDFFKPSALNMVTARSRETLVSTYESHGIKTRRVTFSVYSTHRIVLIFPAHRQSLTVIDKFSGLLLI